VPPQYCFSLRHEPMKALAATKGVNSEPSLIPKLQDYFVEFLWYWWLVSLILLELPTSVGLQYDSIFHFLIACTFFGVPIRLKERTYPKESNKTKWKYILQNCSSVATLVVYLRNRVIQNGLPLFWNPWVFGHGVNTHHFTLLMSAYLFYIFATLFTKSV